MRIPSKISFSLIYYIVMAGLVPAIHDFVAEPS